MNKNLLIGIVAGAALLAVAIWGIFYAQRGAHLQLPGKFLKVRTAPVDDNSSIAMIDFRLTNQSNYPAVIRSVGVALEDRSGKRVEGVTMADADAQRVFDAMPILGQKYNRSLMLQDRVPAHATLDRMIGVRFEIPESRLQDRARLIILIDEVDSRETFEIPEK